MGGRLCAGGDARLVGEIAGAAEQAIGVFISEPILDKRNIKFARTARRWGMQPYLQTRGDVLEGSEDLCKEVLEVYKRIVIGLYD